MQSARRTQQGEPHPGLHALLGAAVTMLKYVQVTRFVKVSVACPVMSFFWELEQMRCIRGSASRKRLAPRMQALPRAAIAMLKYMRANQFCEGICYPPLDVSVCEHCIRGIAGKSVGCG